MKKQAEFSVEFVVSALGNELLDGICPLGEGMVFTSVATDSRGIVKGSSALFVAIKGETFDGHSFVEGVFEEGAMGVVISDKTLSLKLKEKNRAFFLVKDTLLAIRKLAAAWRKLFASIPVVAVAGSVGKTSTKDMLSLLLREKFSKVLSTEASQNGFLGIAITLLKLRDEHQVAVVEIGIDAPGSMQQHAELVGATHAIMTRLGPEHLEQLGSVENVVEEEMKLIQKVLESGNKVFLNASDILQTSWLQKTQLLNRNLSSQVKLFGLKEKTRMSMDGSGVSMHAFDILYGEYSKQDRRCLVYVNEKKNTKIWVFPEGMQDHQVANFLGVYRVASDFGVGDAVVEGFTRHLKASSKRGEQKTLQQSGAILVGDYYNSSPEALRSGLRNVKEDFDLRYQKAQDEPEGRLRPRLFLVLGDMLELGANEKKYHKDLADDVLATRAQYILLFGQRMYWLYEDLSQFTSMSKTVVVKHFQDKSAIVAFLNDHLKEKDTVYLKASRSMKFEEIVDALK